MKWVITVRTEIETKEVEYDDKSKTIAVDKANIFFKELQELEEYQGAIFSMQPVG